MLAAICITTGAFARDVEGQGDCRGAFLIWHACQSHGDAYFENGNRCGDLAYEIAGNSTTDTYRNLYNDCNNAFSYMEYDDLMNYCADAVNSPTYYSWYEVLDNNYGYGSMCEFGAQMPYHIRFGDTNATSVDDVLYAAFDELAFGDDQTSIRCYNGDEYTEQLYLTVCDCGDHMEDLSSWYEPCPINIATQNSLEPDMIGTCYLGNDGATTLLCVPFDEVFNEDGCDLCFCEGSDGDEVEGDWESIGYGALYAANFEFIDLNSNRAEQSSWGSTAYGCSTNEIGYWGCENGYYYNANNNCSTCPVHESGKQTSSYGNRSGINACYIPTGTYSDTTGTFEYTGPCKYN